jgi:ribose transport system permease protein
VTSTVADAAVARPRIRWRRLVARHGWTVGVWLLFLLMVPYWRSLSSQPATFDIQSLAIDVLPLALAAMAQAVVIISGGIDLSVGSLMSLINVVSAKYMVHMSYREALLYAFGLILLGALAGAFTGTLIVLSRIPDIVVTLAMLFVWAGLALQILEIPGGGAPQKFLNLGTGTSFSKYLPTSALVLACALLVVWLPIRWTKPGLALYAVGSNRNAAYLAGIGVDRTRIGAYALGGAFAAMGGLALTASSGIGDPNAGAIYTLNSVAAAVLGGVSLLGGVGGLIGPIAAAGILTLVKTILILRGANPNYAQVYQGAIIIVVVMLGGLVARRGARR